MTKLTEPPPPTLGTLQAIAKDFEQSEGKTGMDYVVARLKALNSHYCWTPGARNKEKTNWGQVNRHLWRIQAMYHGGDCCLASFPGAIPHQKLWPAKGCIAGHLAENHPTLVQQDTSFFKGKRMKSYTCSIVGYRQPKADPDNYNPDEWDEEKWSETLVTSV